MTGEEILDLPMGENDAGAETIRDYLKRLLEVLWEEGEGFSGKRPFGNSGWDWDFMPTLIEHGVITATLDEYGDISELSKAEEKKANRAIFDAIEAL